VIFLSWIQNFFERFKKEEEAVQQEIHTNQPSIQQKRQQPAHKDLDARITYQYPKGHFRFPIIPDEKKTIRHEKEHVEKKRQPKDRNQSKDGNQSKDRNQSKDGNQSKDRNQSKDGNQSKDRNQSQRDHEQRLQKEAVKPKKVPLEKIHSNGPFRPTEIPSPVFGFNRPKTTAVEYELSHFAIDAQDHEDAALLKDSKGIEESEPIASIESENIIQESEAVLGDVVSDDRELVEAKVDNETFQNDSVLDRLLFEIESDEEDQDVIDSLENDHENNMIEQVQTEVELASVEVAAAITTEQLSFENSETCEDIDEEFTEAVVDQIKNDERELVASKDEPEENIDELELEKPKRKHLPFNVMMLKQDKQKWEEKRQQKEKPSISLQSTPSVPIEEVVPKKPSVPIEESVPKMETNVKEMTVNSEEDTYEFPAFDLLNPPIVLDIDSDWLKEQENLLNQTLENFNVGAKVVNMTQGPSVTRFEVHPEPGVKVNKVTNLTDDIKLSLAARDIRMEAPIPGKHTIGIEVPNQKSRPVQISEIILSHVFRDSVSPLTAVLGLDISGKPIVTDLKKMPHGLIAGATGSGKSVCINTILVSLLYKASPDDLKLLLIDPKMVELAPYNRIPHLVSPVITDVKAATASLKWAVEEMERRYELFAHTGVRDINRFNELAMQHKRYSDKLPFIVIVIDELADLMMMSPADVEEAICRIAQKARACGIHLIIATQRPSVDVITGLIKANIPTRIAFSVSSQVDSRTIIDIGGAEKLLGRGDMLFLENGSSKPVRLQGTFVSDDEIDLVVAHVREQQEANYLFEQEELLKKAQVSEEEDELFYEAIEFVVDQSSASTSSLQRRFKIGYNRAARLMEMMEQQGYISSAKGSKPRDVLITAADLETIQETGI
jgi:DNA segregation ATPase FtsK/SpoIIIE, S-DNA-T family